MHIKVRYSFIFTKRLRPQNDEICEYVCSSFTIIGALTEIFIQFSFKKVGLTNGCNNFYI